MQQPIVVGLGELLWDCFGADRRPGGAPANFAFHANQLGLAGTVVSRVGQDLLGDELITFLRQQGLDPSHVQQDAGHPTGTVTVDATDPTHPQYTIHEAVAWDHLAWTSTLGSLAVRVAAVGFGSLAQRSPTTRQTMMQFLDATPADALRVFDVNLRQHYYDRAGLEASFERSSIVKLNDQEWAPIAKLMGWSAADEAEFAGLLRQHFGVRLVCVTRGAHGCWAMDAGDIASAGAEPTTVVDAVGAGDAFTAALIRTRLDGWPLDRSLRFANRVGALVVAHAGAMPDLRDPFARLLAKA